MKKSAFTLVELSIVLVIIGLLVGGSFKVLKIMRERAQISRAQDDVQVAKEAVIGNTVQNSNTLPSVTFFNQNLSPVKNNQHQLFYADDTNLENIDVCSFNTTNLKVVTPARTIDNVAFVIASESSNHNMQTAIKDNGDGTFSVKTYDYSTKVDDNTSPVNIIDYYDDIVEWVTLAQLKEKLNCPQSGLKIINDNNLLDGLETLPYPSSEIFAEGGTPFVSGGAYKWCTEYTVGDNPDSWLQVNCDGTQFDLEADCQSATYRQCNRFHLEGKNGASTSVVGIHKVKTYLMDQANFPINKTFLIKINTDLNSSGTGLLPKGAFCIYDSQCLSDNCKKNKGR